MTTTPERWFYRCSDCLAVSAVDGPRLGYTTERGYHPGARCACGGHAAILGRVARGRLSYTAKVSACDARCTSAPGPSCDCKCKGENHGTGRVVDVQVDAGGVPRLAGADVDRGHAWRWTLAALWAAAEERAPMLDYRRGIRVGPAAFRRCLELEDAIADAKHAKTWKGRAAKVEAALVTIAGRRESEAA